MVLKANDRRTSCPCYDEFRGPRSDYVRQSSDVCTLEADRKDIMGLPPPPSVTARRLSGDPDGICTRKFLNSLSPKVSVFKGYVKSSVYADKPQTLDDLEDNILLVIAYIRPQMLDKVIENWTSRLDYIRASRGSPMPEIIFKMVGYVQWTTSPPVLRVEQSTLTSHPVRNARLKRDTGKYADGR
ncbi:hypothetical protein TNCV_4214551 [Trichonephila clavipes]|nr:hypothetical protein TNCV_4214551 [Trichonephila clavipes]